MLWALFVLTFFAILFACNISKFSEKYRKVASWLACRKEVAWTTYYFKTRNANHMHLVPLDGQEHVTDEDGNCMCHTNKETYRNEAINEDTVVYRHERLGLRLY